MKYPWYKMTLLHQLALGLALACFTLLSFACVMCAQRDEVTNVEVRVGSVNL